MKRRDYLATLGGLGVAGSASLAGCAGLFETRSVRAPPLVENRPAAVYVPTHTEGMAMAGMASAGRLRMALTYSFPHRFWLIDGRETTQVDISGEDAVHLMVSVWDAETGMVIPASNPSLTITKDGESIHQNRSLWRMLSQNMGVHFGDNLSLDGDGTYEVTVDYGPLDTRTTGVFQGAFDERISLEFTMEFAQRTLDDLPFNRLEERQGERGAVEPMQMEMVPIPRVRPAAEMPGVLRAQGQSGDAQFVATVLDERPDGITGTGQYLAVSPRTPYNRYPIPNLTLDATVAQADERRYDGALTATLSPTLDYHYGASVEGVQAGDSLTVEPLLPPQISRHEGYETAFMDMAPMELTLESA